jgi:hypothetical protein
LVRAETGRMLVDLIKEWKALAVEGTLGREG